MKIGLDVGSTTLKCVVMDEKDNLLFSSYERHFSRIKEKTITLFEEIRKEFPNDGNYYLSVSGSAGMGLAQRFQIPFIQEVYATRLAVMKMVDKPDVVIELGGEDAKILFLSGGMDVRMNGSCAGGTGAFIDQMATLMGITLTEMNQLAKSYDKTYTIASRCGVFAKSDIQPLLNQGASKSDISKSIFNAVVNQTIGGLAQGRPINGKIVYLGGPLTFFSQLRESFNSGLQVNGICPDHSLYFVAMGAALSPMDKMINLEDLIYRLNDTGESKTFVGLKKLFEREEDYLDFKNRHDGEKVSKTEPSTYNGHGYLGIDAGSTTI